MSSGSPTRPSGICHSRPTRAPHRIQTSPTTAILQGRWCRRARACPCVASTRRRGSSEESSPEACHPSGYTVCAIGQEATLNPNSLQWASRSARRRASDGSRPSGITTARQSCDVREEAVARLQQRAAAIAPLPRHCEKPLARPVSHWFGVKAMAINGADRLCHWCANEFGPMAQVS